MRKKIISGLLILLLCFGLLPAAVYAVNDTAKASLSSGIINIEYTTTNSAIVRFDMLLYAAKSAENMNDNIYIAWAKADIRGSAGLTSQGVSVSKTGNTFYITIDLEKLNHMMVKVLVQTV